MSQAIHRSALPLASLVLLAACSAGTETTSDAGDATAATSFAACARGCAGVDAGRDGLGICRGPRRDARLPGHVGRLAAGRRGGGAHPGDPRAVVQRWSPRASRPPPSPTRRSRSWRTSSTSGSQPSALRTPRRSLRPPSRTWPRRRSRGPGPPRSTRTTRPAATSRTAGCTVRSRGRSTRMIRQAMSTMSASGYAAAMTFSIGEFVPCCRAGPSTKYRLKVTAAVITVNPSTTTRARAATGIGPATAGSPAGAGVLAGGRAARGGPGQRLFAWSRPPSSHRPFRSGGAAAGGMIPCSRLSSLTGRAVHDRELGRQGRDR